MRIIWILSAHGILLAGAMGGGQPSGPAKVLRQEPLNALPQIEDKDAICPMPKNEQEPLHLTPGKHTIRIALSLDKDPFSLIEELSPDKGTVRVRAPSSTEAARPVSRPIEIVIEKGKPQDEKPAWSEAVEGVQIRLRPGKVTWGANEAPTFELDLRNQGKKTFAQARTPLFCQIEVDGKWYVYGRPWVLDGALSRLEPGTHVDSWVQVTLVGRWVRKKPGD